MSVSVMSAEAIAQANAALEGKSPQQILRWAVAEFHPHLMMATAFGAEGCCLMHMLAEIEPNVRIINLDTGYQFQETLELRERIKDRYGIAVEMVRPELSVEEYEREHGGPLYTHRPDQCCHDRKIIPLRKSIGDARAWISAIRKDQTNHRGAAEIVMWDKKFNLVKVNPLLGWGRSEVWKFIVDHNVPYNPLHDQNYPSIGCWPCTAPVGEGQDERAGRWAGTAKKECGLHVIEHKDGSGI
ncbi:phosphoadenylyl-sulfate reductase [Tuwongella immobilis]|uniref:Adenosine 5'-phosphosulfate reductase n=1 Tax=Tuwongella immobilis TaxID=692036 RepID=A0A6C2YIH6_9BACT|nr:phosphoadenylyl-sulfate reductase [Tuwongella immobilis]VIP01330.1 phosphoadenosine phosphosulfate reductase : Phosphoadenosine phosphosulfate reductase OS=Singulisphaera acidiphila (strain ATCC BAA-1392 / DSM 18658 / VKM B-2454 / MOB10) GN=cysH PE=3 SV=1: PAPS_reduct [Tuwongella immobilis]VTR98086.1 phosphoadenosine phosphosulfate reductase : Phosphoadenosine phosphosulfate reductase OS=Singulisphaera acidiphila (strain ATCC BAA-1392 / DSM 18658 / VKM B-2454 / MOB10) GN=cysH PE=3 SV=1: PAPS_r